VVGGAMGGGVRREQLALGDTPNVAARLEGLASPDTIVISGATQRLIRGAFACQELGTHTLEGVSTPVHVFRVLREHDPQSRLDMAVSAGLTPLVGREQELDLLVERWAEVKEGQGQVVLLSGEPGIGKSRLVQAFRERVSGEQHVLVEWHGSPHHKQSPLYPVITQLHRGLGWRQDAPPQEKLRKLEAMLEEHGLALAEAVPLLASLLSLPLPERYPLLPMEPPEQKQRTLETLLAWQLRATEQRPVVLIVEDLHWLDPSTLEFLTVLVDRAATLRLFMLLTYRSTFRPSWGPRTHLTSLLLGRLPRQQAALMIERVTGSKALPVEVREHLLATTDGVPLFIEELTKAILESELLRRVDDRYELTGPLPTLAIPATLHDSLITRLDRLPAAKPIAQLGATIGRQFSFELLHAVSPVDDATLQQALGQLVDAELLYQRGLPPSTTYMFKHSLIQQAAYQSLLKTTRQQYHQRIAQVLVERFAEIVETQPELLAHHYTEAGLAAQAVPYWQRAGQRAIERSANLEAISHLTRGLEALKALPDTPEHAQQELMLQLAVGAPLLMIKGYPAPEVEHAYTRALKLCQEHGDSVQLFSALSGLWGLYLTRPRLPRARDLAEQALTLAQRMADQALLQQAHLMLGASLFYLGEFSSAREYLQEAVALYQPPRGRSWVLGLGADPGARCLAWAAWTLWILGYPARALARMEEALSVAEQMSHAFTRAWVLHFAATLHSWRGELQLTQERAELEIGLSTEQNFVRWLAGGMVRRGWVMAMTGAPEEGIAQLSQGVATWRAMAGELGLTSILAQQAEAYGKGGRIKDGLSVLAEALALVERNAEHYYEAELHRLKGELLLQAAVQDLEDHPQRPSSAPSALQTEEAEACFRQALDIARRRQAKMHELRAALNLARLWQMQGKRGEARQLLADIYGWFTEGFDTLDLRDARDLLEVLA